MDIIHGFHYIMSDKLEPHPIAQRAFNKQHANKISKNFDENMMQPITVSYRDGKYYILDGQHRKYAAEKHNNGPVSLECKIYYGLTLDDEVAIFKALNAGVKIPKTEDIMHVDYLNDECYAKDIVGACNEFGYSCSFGDKYRDYDVKSGKTIVASYSLKNAYEKLGHDGFRDMLEIISESWGNSTNGIRAEMIRCLAIFLEKYAKDIDKKRLIRKLSKVSPGSIIGMAAYPGKSANSSRAYAILGIYNKGNSINNQLPDRL